MYIYTYIFCSFVLLYFAIHFKFIKAMEMLKLCPTNAGNNQNIQPKFVSILLVF